ncbi:hypothetical protein STSP2_00249 [Anaerohalosphaera lusitana]|uniref:Uncharacterized protein n=1 Tax=Anaerohalosphaera lusitana TaxID=1936003 RepID=A0A1U9NH75_9BACT|nr:hypothetical protein [Anaerohalosphaera lusitana]AQT67108.1 hypothetical protein STSP2_00249 [Anaerohalosphaera lusitana]
MAGIKLAMGLTGGDFWARPQGCVILCMRDARFEDEKLGRVFNSNAEEFVLSEIRPEAVGNMIYAYVRRINFCGQEEAGLDGCICLIADENGKWVNVPAHGVLDITAVRESSANIQLQILYISSENVTARFYVYDGSATEENKIAEEELGRSGVHSFRIVLPDEQTSELQLILVNDEGAILYRRDVSIQKAKTMQTEIYGITAESS